MAQAGETSRVSAVREGVVTNSACGMLSSDGRRVFAIDMIPTGANRGATKMSTTIRGSTISMC